MSKIENGQIIPSLPRLKIIADALRLDLEYFIRPKAVVASLEHVIGARLRKRKDEMGVSLSRLADQTWIVPCISIVSDQRQGASIPQDTGGNGCNP
ncbi:MAG: helix-turn-helix transcriptional regulator [Deltaproteobacteria bacterium]|nr:helix-turn-helix transcriptional regulator [Deltaproteobacteria bacterium]